MYETCLLCGGSGRNEHGDPCNDCDGLGKFNVDDFPASAEEIGAVTLP